MFEEKDKAVSIEELDAATRREAETDETAERESDRRRDETDEREDTGYDDGGADPLEHRVSNSIGRGAVENLIKNSVYEKYNIDAKAMKDFSRLTPTEMLSRSQLTMRWQRRWIRTGKELKILVTWSSWTKQRT